MLFSLRSMQSESALGKKSWYAILMNCLNYAAGLFFVIAVALTVYFVTSSLKVDTCMSNDSNSSQILLTDGARIPVVQKVAVGPDNTRECFPLRHWPPAVACVGVCSASNPLAGR